MSDDALIRTSPTDIPREVDSVVLRIWIVNSRVVCAKYGIVAAMVPSVRPILAPPGCANPVLQNVRQDSPLVQSDWGERKSKMMSP
jgi:hypothetical protein